MTERYLITRTTVEDADVYRAFDEGTKGSISEVHYANGMGKIGTYGADLDEAAVEAVRGASNLIKLTRISDFGLGGGVEPDPEGLFDPVPRDYLTGMGVMPGIGHGPEDLPAQLDQARAYWYWQLPRIRIDQRKEGACVGFSITNLLNCGPKFMSELGDAYAQALYEETKRNDPWPGEDYDGTSLASGMIVLQNKGLAERAMVARTEEEHRRFQVYEGGTVWSMAWYEGMYTPDAEGYIRPTGRLVGRHAIYERGRSAWDSSRMLNSWGGGWGFRGMGWISKADREWLRRNDRHFTVYCARQIKDAA